MSKFVTREMQDFFNWAFGDWTDPKKPNQPRDLTEADRIGWDVAMDQRAASKMRPQTREDIIRLIRNRNPLRWHGFVKDYKWVQKEMKKLGLNPDDARYLL